MKKKFISIIISVLFVVCCLFGCAKKKTDEELIRERITSFVTVYNDGDFDGVLDCFDAKTRNTLKATFNVLGGLVGGLTGYSFDLSDFFTLGIAMMDGEVLAIEVDEISIDGENAVVSAKMGYSDIGPESIEIVYIILVKENDDWFIQDMQGEPPAGMEIGDGSNETNNSTTVQSAYKITNMNKQDGYYFIDGYTMITCSKGNEVYNAVIDESGKIKWLLDINKRYDGERLISTEFFGKGSTIFVTDKTVEIIGLDGQIKATLTGEYEIKAYGGGYVWLYQDASDISTVKHLYGVMDYNGNWVQALTDLGVEGKWDNVSYIGDGVFGAREKWSSMTYAMMKPTSQGVQTIATMTNLYTDRSLDFENGLAYAPMGKFNNDSTTLSNGSEQNISSDFILKTDGTYTEIATPDIYTNGKALYDEDGHYKIIDYTKATPTSAIYNNYAVNQIASVEFVGDYGLVKINGADGKDYFTVINTQGQELYEPKEYDDWYSVRLFVDGNVYHNGKHFNTTGVETTVSYKDYSDAGRKYLAKWDSSSGYSYYKANGEKLFDKLYR